MIPVVIIINGMQFTLGVAYCHSARYYIAALATSIESFNQQHADSAHFPFM